MANTDSGENETTKERKAIHGLLDGAATPTKKFDEAHAITYALVGIPDDVFTYETPAGIPDAVRMLALFGARTLATNTASQLRQAGEDEAEQLAAIRDRFELLDSGTWIERAERVGAKIDLELLARVYVEWAKTEGATKDYATILQKITEDKKAKNAAWGVPDVKAEYQKQAGKPVNKASVLAAL
jgi:hypothetical protein